MVEGDVGKNTYPIAVLKESENPDLARKFVDLMSGAAKSTSTINSRPGSLEAMGLGRDR